MEKLAIACGWDIDTLLEVDNSIVLTFFVLADNDNLEITCGLRCTVLIQTGLV